MRDVWEAHCLVEFLTREGHNLIKDKIMNSFEMENLEGINKTLSTKNTYGALQHLRLKSRPRTTLLQSVAYFEEYLSSLTRVVLIDNPQLLKTNEVTSEKREIKLVNWILECNTKSEILEKVIEERVRSLFYGKPVDFFIKPKLGLKFNDYFKNKCQLQLSQYAEITARRNLVAHNDGRVDSKYLREIANSTFKRDQAIPLKSKYLKDTVELLLYLAARTTELILIHHYSSKAGGKLLVRLKKCKCLPPI